MHSKNGFGGAALEPFFTKVGIKFLTNLCERVQLIHIKLIGIISLVVITVNTGKKRRKSWSLIQHYYMGIF